MWDKKIWENSSWPEKETQIMWTEPIEIWDIRSDTRRQIGAGIIWIPEPEKKNDYNNPEIDLISRYNTERETLQKFAFEARKLIDELENTWYNITMKIPEIPEYNNNFEKLFKELLDTIIVLKNNIKFLLSLKWIKDNEVEEYFELLD